MTRALPRTRRSDRARRPGPRREAGPWPLAVTLAVAATAAAILWRIAGPPSAAWRLPDITTVRTALTATEGSDGDLIAVATAIAWLLLGYLAVTIGLRALAVTADRATRGARWARAALRVTNLITVPAVRRIVDGGVAGTLLLATWLPVPRAAIASAPVAIVALHAPPAAEAHVPAPDDRAATVRAPFVVYTVAPGDDLWGIARRLYGDGSRYVDLFAANRGRVMPDGERFDDPRVVRAGWTLNAPLPAANVSVDAGTVTYRVTRGDHLWGIAERFLGDGFRWDEIWQANRDRDMGGGWRFTDPRLIYPGWVLVLPAAVVDVETGLTVETDNGTLLPQATADTGMPDAASDATTAEDSAGLAWDWPSVPRPVVLSAAGFAVLGAAALFVHRMQRTGALGIPSLLQRGARRTGDAGRVVLAARAVAEALEAAGLARARLVLAHEAERELAFTIDCADADGAALAASRDELADRLDCDVKVVVTGARQVELTLTDAGAPVMQQGAAAPAGRALMLPVGTDGAGRIVYVNLSGVGSVAIAGAEIERRQLLHAWLATLATTAGADELTLRADAPAAALFGDDIDLPHFGGTESPDVEAFVDELEDAIQSRESQLAPRPLVAVLDVDAGGGVYEPLLPYGSRAGIYFVGLAGAETDAPFGATVRLGVDATDAGDDEDAIDAGGVLLTLGSGERMALDPVLVRRDTSPRWREHQEPTERGETPLPPPRDPEPPESSPPSGGLPEPFDWRRAIFDADDTVAEGTVDEEVREVADAVIEQAVVAAHEERERAPGAAVVAVEERAVVEPPLSGAVELLPDPDEASTPTPLSVTLEGRGNQAAGDVIDAGTVPQSRDPLAASVRQQALFLPASDGGPSEADEALIYVRCLGELRITVGGVAAQGWPYDKARELLALLVAHGGAPIPRRAIAEALWPDVLWDASLKHMLANATSALRSVLRNTAGRADLQPLTLAHERYQVPAGMLRSDIDEFEEALRFAAALPPGDALDQYERALKIYEADFLESESFAWLDTYQEEYRQRFVSGALAAAQLATETDDVERAARFYLAATQRVPSNEDAACGLMRCYASVGNTGGVVKVYRVLSEALQSELGPRMGPARETRALLKELTSGAAVG
ncbi:MAG: BTAD domain-containing putative transcriptional regulator [Gemmatimonadaceae bacterium]